MNDYHIHVFCSEADECYIADIPDLFRCSAPGETPDEAVHEVRIAKERWLEVDREKGYPIGLGMDRYSPGDNCEKNLPHNPSRILPV